MIGKFLITSCLLFLTSSFAFKVDYTNENVKKLYNLHKEMKVETNKYVVLKEVNNFFNSMGFSSDKTMGFEEGHIQEMEEFVQNGAGDVEDFVNSKYDFLSSLPAIDVNDLYVIYGKQSLLDNKVKFIHITVAYRVKDKFFVLDNIDKQIKKLQLKEMFLPIVAYNKITKDKITINIDNFQDELKEIRKEDSAHSYHYN